MHVSDTGSVHKSGLGSRTRARRSCQDAAKKSRNMSLARLSAGPAVPSTLRWNRYSASGRLWPVSTGGACLYVDSSSSSSSLDTATRRRRTLREPACLPVGLVCGLPRFFRGAGDGEPDSSLPLSPSPSEDDSAYFTVRAVERRLGWRRAGGGVPSGNHKERVYV